MGFQKDLCESAGIDWTKAQETNVALDELARSRVAKIELDHTLIKSKVAWKFAVLRQALTYRLVDLGEATIEAWNNDNRLSSVVLARAFFETVAIVHSVTMRMQKAVDSRDIAVLDDLAMQESFGSRSPEWVEETGLKSTNVLTALDHMSREIDFARDFYESISETAHPNSFGTQQFYATTDRENIVVHFSRAKRDRAAIFAQINVALFCANWAASKFKKFDSLIEQIAELHAELDTLGPATSDSAKG